jgi:hypothetical protein
MLKTAALWAAEALVVWLMVGLWFVALFKGKAKDYPRGMLSIWSPDLLTAHPARTSTSTASPLD